MVSVAHRLAMAGLALLGVAIVGVVLLIFEFLRGGTVGAVAAAATTVLLVVLWLALPGVVRGRATSRQSSGGDRPD